MSKRGGQPAGWPKDVLYAPLLVIDNKNVDRDLQGRMRKLLANYQTECRRRPESKNVRIKIIDDPSHPAYGQRGLFAARKFEPREWIIHYGGELLPDDDPQLETSDYCLRFVDGHSLDASRIGNEARFANDFRGVPGAERPNVEFSQYDRTAKSGDAAVIGFRVMHGAVRKGEELLASYGKGFWRARGLLIGGGDGDGDGDERAAATKTTNCPGRHGLEPFQVPEGSTYLCFPCSASVSDSATGFRFCPRCNFGVCERCFGTER